MPAWEVGDGKPQDAAFQAAPGQPGEEALMCGLGPAAVACFGGPSHCVLSPESPLISANRQARDRGGNGDGRWPGRPRRW